jgi:cytochrome c2
MPATEQTWRSQKKLHAIFGISSVLLLLATLWMFQADHQREWKVYQRSAREIDVMMTEWRKLAYEVDSIELELADLEKVVDESSAKSIVEGILEQFEKLIADEQEVTPQARDAFRQAADGSSSQTRDAVTAAMDAVIREIRFKEDLALNERKFRSADLDKAKADYGLAIRDGRNQQRLIELRAIVRSVEAEVDELNLMYEGFSRLRIDLQDLRNKADAEQEAAKKALSDARAGLDQLNTAIRERHAGWVEGYWLGKRWLELPILDAFNTPLKIVNNWSDDLEQDYNHRRVRRFDRCATCHQMMEKTLPGSAVNAAYMKERLLQFTLEAGKPPATLSSGSKGRAVKDLQEKLNTELKLEESEKIEVNGVFGETTEKAVEKFQQEKKLPVTGKADADTILQLGVYGPNDRLFRRLGFYLAEKGLVSRGDVTVSYVQGSTEAARAVALRESSEETFDAEVVMKSLLQVSSEASPVRPDDHARDSRPGLEAGDVIVFINGDPVFEGSQGVILRLLSLARSGKPLELTVRRGMPNPFTSHPRLDLFVGSLSPHTVADFACTICHDGQGSATAFKWSSHTPDSPKQREQWLREHNWFDNSHWIYPMYSRRFTESSCLKCHHQVTELAVSEQFPDPPAPNLMGGYNLIRKYGCYGCHEINGFDGPDKRIGPDMRLEPNYFAVAQQIQAEAGFASLDQDQQRLVNQLVDHPENDGLRYQLLSLLDEDARAENGESRFSADVHERLVPLLGDVSAPGSERRPGPSLRYVNSKLQSGFLSDWINHPSAFRPSTRMPQFFGLWNHLPEDDQVTDQFEPLEVFAISHFLLQSSQPFAYLDAPAGVTEVADVDRGQVLFQERGCLACHSHNRFSDVEGYRPPKAIVQGPDLSNLAAKFNSPDGRRWLYSWIREPTRYHARTVMPNLFLEKIPHRDKEGNVTSVTDPAADLVEYLVSTGDGGWSPAEGTIVAEEGIVVENLDELVLEHLKGTFYVVQAREYLERGIPDLEAEETKGAEIELLVSAQDYDAGEALSLDQKLMYVGRRSIAKYGCYGCHDIPGFEEAKPIGTTLADWGRKETSKLAYEHILEYLGLGHHGGGHAGHGDDHDHASEDMGDEPEVRQGHFDDDMPEFFEQQLQSHNRIGFLYQKLREPRGYDFEKTREKGFNDRLRMPRFPFSTQDREEVMTFILGLVSDPPRDRFVYQPDRRSAALQQGERVLQKYNCRGCHMLTPEKWDVAFDASQLDIENETSAFPPLANVPSFPFTMKQYSAAEMAASRELDHRSQMHATLVGMPALADDALPTVFSQSLDDNLLPEDEDVELADLTQVPFHLWQPALVGGTVYQAGSVLPRLNPALVTRRQAADGGVLARYLLTHVTRREKQINPNAKGTESWSWVPPPLVGQGTKVQSGWLHDFLLDPYPIRPAVVLRMPRFNMSPDEATALVNYFAARDDANYPYAYNQERDQEELQARESKYMAGLADPAARAEESASEGTRFNDAMRIVTSPDYCVKCHIVGDFSPEGADRGKAPDLTRVFERLRPDYIRRWIARPNGILPYTSMPINIQYKPEDAPFQGGVDQQLYHGTSTEQVDALVDLLMNYDKYAGRRASVRPLVEAAARAKQEEAADPVDPAAESEESDEETTTE